MRTAALLRTQGCPRQDQEGSIRALKRQISNAVYRASRRQRPPHRSI